MDRSADIVESALAPPEDDEGPVSIGPMPWLRARYDLTYWEPFEFGSTSPFSKLMDCATDELFPVIQSLTVAVFLMEAAIRLVGDGLIAYAEKPQPRSEFFRFLPPALITFVSGFEALVRLQSETLVHVAKVLPPAVRLALMEVEEVLERDGRVIQRPRSRSTLDRYSFLLKYGYNFDVDRGSLEWQRAEESIHLRNEIVHYEVRECPSLKASSVLHAMEGLLLALIAPSAQLRRSVWSGQFEQFFLLDGLREALDQVGDFEEAALHKRAQRRGSAVFPCSFLNVDDARYPHYGATLGVKDDPA